MANKAFTGSWILCLSIGVLQAADPTLPDGPGKDTVVRVCSQCHGVEVAASHRDSPEGWNAIVNDMIQRGATGTDDEFSKIVDYLSAHFPKNSDAPKIAVNTASAVDLVAGLAISDKDAAAIVQYREEKGKFKTFDDLMKVPGVDTAKLQAKKDNLVF